MTLRSSVSPTLCILLALCFAAPALSNAADDLPATFGSPPKGRFVVSKSPYFLHPERAMRQRVAFDKKNRVTNHFCVVGYEWPDGNLQVWVNWKEEKTNILWDGSEYRDMREAGLTTARRNLKLGRDTVETVDDINGSTYLVTHARWHSIADDCAAHGEKYVIKPFSIRHR
ncbi:hypothetical protein [Cupriavidus sp. WS]|uniref:hypothetical protein n=1 Tax=Cupriavidus sp. WS TaxID=1312922 RepID=UPI00048CDF4E|nr:hypothetical protein [Cupriavidus sp. WS]